MALIGYKLSASCSCRARAVVDAVVEAHVESHVKDVALLSLIFPKGQVPLWN